MKKHDERFTLRAAVYLLLMKKDMLLLARRFNTGWMDGHFSLVAGHLDGKESVSYAMIREAYEEAGITVNPENLIPATVIHRYSTDKEYMDFFFICKKWQGDPSIMEKDKCDLMGWYPINKLPDKTLTYIQEAIKNYKNRVPFSEYGWKNIQK